MNTPYFKFKNTHEQLKTMMLSVSNDEAYLHLLQKTITKYISLMMEDKADEQEKMFDFFCQYNGIQILSKLMLIDPLLAIKSYSLLFINLKHQNWISYILCQSFLMQAIGVKSQSNDEEWTQYFISFLKSLSIRINQTQIILFYNQKNCTFPLIYGAIKYFNHPDFMVRTSVMNIILQIMKIKQKKSLQYFSRFPFTTYIITFVCQIYQFIQTFNTKLLTSAMTTKDIKNYETDLLDYLYYFNDLTTFGTNKCTQIIENSIIYYLIYPIFKYFSSDNDKIITHGLFILNQMILIIKNKIVIETIVVLLLENRIEQEECQFIIKNKGQVYLPQIFKQEFNPHHFYWNKYQKDIRYHCQKVFEQDPKMIENAQEYIPNAQFMLQIQRISNFLHYDLLNNKRTQRLYIQRQYQLLIKKQNEVLIVQGRQNGYVDNMFRERLIKMSFLGIKGLYQQNINNNSNEIRLIINCIMINIISNPIISKQILAKCQLTPLYQQQTHLYQQQQQITSSSSSSSSSLLSKINKQILTNLQKIQWNLTPLYNLQLTLELYNLINRDKVQQIQFEQKILQNYRELTLLLKQLMIIDKLITITDHFYTTYERIRLKYSNKQKQKQKMSIPLIIMFDKMNCKDIYRQYQLPPQQDDLERVKYYINMFWIYRWFIVHYFNTHYDVQYVNFGQEYAALFLQANRTWKKGHHYKMTNKILIPCYMQSKQGKKDRKIMMIQDKYNLILAETNSSNLDCQIILNESWKKIDSCISKEDGLLLQIKVKEKEKDRNNKNKDNKQVYRLFFDDQIQSNSTLVKMADLKWKCYELEYSFIYKFIKQAITQ